MKEELEIERERKFRKRKEKKNQGNGRRVSERKIKKILEKKM